MSAVRKTDLELYIEHLALAIYKPKIELATEVCQEEFYKLGSALCTNSEYEMATLLPSGVVYMKDSLLVRPGNEAINLFFRRDKMPIPILKNGIWISDINENKLVNNWGFDERRARQILKVKDQWLVYYEELERLHDAQSEFFRAACVVVRNVRTLKRLREVWPEIVDDFVLMFGDNKKKPVIAESKEVEAWKKLAKAVRSESKGVTLVPKANDAFKMLDFDINQVLIEPNS